MWVTEKLCRGSGRNQHPNKTDESYQKADANTPQADELKNLFCFSPFAFYKRTDSIQQRTNHQIIWQTPKHDGRVIAGEPVIADRHEIDYHDNIDNQQRDDCQDQQQPSVSVRQRSLYSFFFFIHSSKTHGNHFPSSIFPYTPQRQGSISAAAGAFFFFLRLRAMVPPATTISPAATAASVSISAPPCRISTALKTTVSPCAGKVR